MHAILFGLKRAWHGTLRVTRHALACHGLTAARFDLLYALQRAAPYASVTQRALRKTLGVNRTTISRMLGSLEAMGLLTRVRDPDDRRTRAVRLTGRGRKRIRVAMRRLIDRGAAQLAVDSAIAGAPAGRPGDSWHDDRARVVAGDTLESFLRGLRLAYGDVATLPYPWRPDD